MTTEGTPDSAGTSNTEPVEPQSPTESSGESSSEPTEQPSVTTPAPEGEPKVNLVDEKFEFTVAEGMDVEKESLSDFKTFSMDNKLPSDMAQSVLDYLLKVRVKSETAQKELIQKNKDLIKSDPDIGKTNYDKVQAAVDRITLKYGGQDFKTQVASNGLKDDPAFLTFFKNLDLVLSEDQVLSASQSASLINVDFTEKEEADHFINN